MSLASPIVALPPYEVAGPDDAPVIAVLGGISATRHVCACEADRSPGWWQGVAGPGRALDTNRFRIVSFDYLDGGRGPDGRPARAVSTHEQADALAAVFDECEVGAAHAVIGASYGGMVALAFGERHSDRAKRLIVIGAAHRAHPLTTALRAIQRRVVELGLDTGRERDGLALARALAITTYRTAREFAARFPSERAPHEGTFPSERWVMRHGERFAATWEAHRFVALSLSSDRHHVDAGAVRVPTTLVAAAGDTNVPRELIDELAASIGASCTVVDLPTEHGHDAFLADPETIACILTSALSEIAA